MALEYTNAFRARHTASMNRRLSVTSAAIVGALIAMILVFCAAPAIRGAYLSGLFDGDNNWAHVFPEVALPFHHPFLILFLAGMGISVAATGRRVRDILTFAAVLGMGVWAALVYARFYGQQQHLFWVGELADTHQTIAILFECGDIAFGKEIDSQNRLQSGRGIVIVPNPARDLGLRVLRNVRR
jgi:ABC-type Na+ efflux pump permease subunit